MEKHVFPGHGVPVDERIVAPESRAEILEGRLLFSPPAEERHAVPHADLAYVLRGHVQPSFLVAVDMLTRSGLESDFAPDASVYEAERDPETGGRRLEQLAFEIVNEQTLATQTTKARALASRGVRRVFVLIVKSGKVLEWSKETDAWSATPLETIDDRCFVRPLRTAALVDAVIADDAVLRALLQRGHPIFQEVREEGREAGREAGREEGREEGREAGREEGLLEGREQGLEKGLETGLETGLRIAVVDLCESFDIALDPSRRTALATMGRPELQALRLALKRTRAWP